MQNIPSAEDDLDAIRERGRREVAAAQDVPVDGHPSITVRDEANALVANVLRNNTFFEHLHSGASSPLVHDPTLSRITDDEVKRLMIEVSARLAYMLALKASNPAAYFDKIEWNRDRYTKKWERHATTWEAPEASRVEARCCASCGGSLYKSDWRFCPLCGVPAPK